MNRRPGLTLVLAIRSGRSSVPWPESGTTVLLCTQYLEEADQLAEGIAVIDRGRVIAEGTPAQLKRSFGSSSLHVRLLDPSQRPEAIAIVEGELGPLHGLSDPTSLSVVCGNAGLAAGVVSALDRAGIGVADFSLSPPSLDEVFLALTGHRTGQPSDGDPSDSNMEASS